MSVKKFQHYLEEGIWSFRAAALPRGKSVAVRFLRVIILAIRDFMNDNCQLRASAITFYSVLSVVPVMAMLFGIAKGFGFEHTLKNYLQENFVEQKQVITQIFIFAESMLQRTKGEMIAGVGVAFLFWAVVKMLGNIETSLNHIWRVRKGRQFTRKLADYIFLMMLAAVMIVISGSATVFISTQLNQLAGVFAPLSTLTSPLIFAVIKLIPYVIVWFLFTFLYMYIPNTKVSLISAFIGGLFCGTLFQFLQEGYIILQVALSSYNAIYGSFSALPLFLIWLQLSWLIFLFGAELAFAHQNSDNFEFEVFTEKISYRAFQTFAVKTAALLIKNFLARRQAFNIHEISVLCHMSIGLTRNVLNKLIAADVVVESSRTDDGGTVYQPACGTEVMTVAELLHRIDRIGMEKIDVRDVDFERVAVMIDEMEDVSGRSRGARRLCELQVAGMGADEI